MEQNTGQEKQTPAPKKKMNNFRKAFLWTAIPIIVSTAIGIPGAMAPETAWVGFSVFGGIIALGLWGLAILSCIGFAIAQKRQIALGILSGVGIGFLCLALTFVVSEANQPPP